MSDDIRFLDYRDKEIQEIFQACKVFRSKRLITLIQQNYFLQSEGRIYQILGKKLDHVEIKNPSLIYRKIIIEKNYEEVFNIQAEQ